MDPELDVERARFNMVEQQIRPWEVLDQRVLDLLFAVKREEFVPPQYRSLAFVDMEIPHRARREDARPQAWKRACCRSSRCNPTDRMLEVGTGSGYMTALLARCGGHVYSVDIVPEFTQAAAAKLAAHGITNVTLETGDAARGWDRHGALRRHRPDRLGAGPAGSIPARASRPAAGCSRSWASRRSWKPASSPAPPPAPVRRIGLFETCIAPLRNAAQPERFVF